MTEPEAGSDLRGMRTRAVRDGAGLGDHRDQALHQPRRRVRLRDPVRGHRRPGGRRRPRRAEITAFLVDLDAPGLTVRPGYRSVSHRGYNNSVLIFDGCRVPAGAVLGAVGRRLRRGQHLAGHHPAAGRRDLPGSGPPGAGAGRAARGQPPPVRPPDRPQPGRVVQTRRHEHRAGGGDAGSPARRVDGRRRARRHGRRLAMAKLYASEALAVVADEALQIHGGMGLMDELRWNGSGGTPGWSGSGTAPGRSSGTSSPASLLRAHGG